VCQESDREMMDRLVDLVNSAFVSENAYKEGPRTDLNNLLQMMAEPTLQFLLLLDGTELIGSVYSKKKEGKDSLGYLGMISVLPSKQNLGLGTKLLQAAEGRLRELGCKIAELQVINLREDIIAYYKKRGYLQLSPENNRPFNIPQLKVPCSFVVMQKSLI